MNCTHWFQLSCQTMPIPPPGRLTFMCRSEAIRLFLFLLVVSLAGMTGCNNFFVPVCQETNTCNAGTGGAGSPTITSISPTSGSSGTTVTLTGTNYTGTTAVAFGSVAAATFNVVSATQITAVAPAGTGSVYITVTNASGTSNGESFSYGTAAATSYIYVANQNAGTLSVFSLSAGTLYNVSGSPFTVTGAPSAIATTPSGSLLYEASTSGAVYVYTIGSNGAPTLGNSGTAVVSLVSAPTYMAIDSTGTWLFLVSSTASQLLEYQITPSTGALTAATGSPFTLGGGDPTQIFLTPNNQFVYVGEALNTSGTGVGGMDSFTLDATTGALANPLHYPAKTSLSSDDALGGDAKSQFLFVGETASGIRAFSIGTGGRLTEVTGSPFPSALGPSAIAMDPTNTYVYVAYRYADKIEGYTLGSTGALTLLSSSPFGTGSQPIAMSLDANSQYMVVADFGGIPDLEVFSFDATSAGKLDPVANTVTGTDPTVPISMAVAK